MAGEQDESAQWAALEKEMATPDPEVGKLEALVNFDDVPDSPEPSPQPQPQQRHAEPQPQPRQRQDPEPQPQPRHDGLPDDPLDDPIAYFQGKNAAIEQHIGQKAFVDAVRQSEDAFRNDLEDPTEYADACDHARDHRMAELRQIYPDTQASLQVARQYGFNHPDGRAAVAQLRHAILMQDIEGIAASALQQGIPPALAYYQAAMSRGFKPRSVMLNSYRRNIMKELSQVSDKDENHPVNKGFDIFWDEYARLSKQREATAE